MYFNFTENKIMLLEIAVSNIEAALLAESAGADRIELCDNLAEGGTTPSFGYLQYAITTIKIPVFPIIRPRGGNFNYTTAEFETMLLDIAVCKQLGYKGIVTGILLPNGNIDVVRTKLLVAAAAPMQVTFHRAYDRTNNAQTALEDVIKTGCNRILTSGLYTNVNAGLATLVALVQQAGKRIIIMPGSGVRSTNLEQLIIATKATEYHSSAAVAQQNNMEFKNENFEITDGIYNTVATTEIEKQKAILAKHK